MISRLTHAQLRAYDRYGVYLAVDDIERMAEKIRNAQASYDGQVMQLGDWGAHRVGDKIHKRGVFAVRWKHRRYVVLVQPHHDHWDMVTFFGKDQTAPRWLVEQIKASEAVRQ